MKHEQTILIMSDRISEEKEKIQKQEDDLKKHIDQNTMSVIEHLTASHQQEMKYLQQEITKLRNDANVVKIRQIQKKLVENRFINHEMVDFYQKINTLFMVLNKTKASPSVSQLYKWVSIRKAEELTNAFTASVNASRIASSNSINRSSISKKSKSNGQKLKSASNSNLYEIDLIGGQSKLQNTLGKQNGPQLKKTSTKRTADTTTKRKPPSLPKKKKENIVSNLFEKTESIYQKPSFENETIRNASLQKTKEKYFSTQRQDK